METQGIMLDEQRYKAMLRGKDLDRRAVEVKLLLLLAAAPGRIYGRQQIMEKIYPDDRFVSDRTIDSHIKKLRKKIEQAAPDADLIRSVYGAGYQFEPGLD